MKYTSTIAVVIITLITVLFPVSCAGNAESADALSSPSVPSSSAPLAAAPANVPTDVVNLFSLHGWTVAEHRSSAKATLPESLVTTVEDSPMQFYWMRVDILSGDIGLDLKSFLGKKVDIEVYGIWGETPEKYRHPAMSDTRGVVFRSAGGGIVGAHIDTGRHAGIAYSLPGHDVQDISGVSLEEYWQKNYYDPDDPINKTAADRTAEQVITQYLEGMAIGVTTGDTAAELSTLTVAIKLDALFVNLDNALPFNNTPELYHYLAGVKVLKISKFPDGETGSPAMYGVDIDAKLTKEAKYILEGDGKMTRFVSVGKENGRLCVYSDGTGP